MTLTSTYNRPATLEDELHLLTCFSRMLRELEPLGHDILPTDHNLDFFWDHIFAPALDTGEHGIMLALADTEVVGASFFAPERSQLDVPPGRAIAYGLWVDPEWRRQGIAKGLHAAAHQRLLECGCTTLLSYVLVSNKPGLANVKSRDGYAFNAYQVTIPLKGDY